MNHFFLDVRSRERIKELRNEGLVNQALHRSETIKPDLFKGIWRGISTIMRSVFRNSQAEKKTVIESRAHI